MNIEMLSLEFNIDALVRYCGNFPCWLIFGKRIGKR